MISRGIEDVTTTSAQSQPGLKLATIPSMFTIGTTTNARGARPLIFLQKRKRKKSKTIAIFIQTSNLKYPYLVIFSTLDCVLDEL